jgi:hypothetical protein
MAIRSEKHYPIARKTGLVIQELPGEVLVYDLETNKAYCLNESAAMVWGLCDGRNSVVDIMQGIEAGGRGKVNEVFVWLALDSLGQEDLLDIDVPTRFRGQSRRDILKKISLISVVALPMVVSLIAPHRALGFTSCACASDAQCSMPGCDFPHCNNLGLCQAEPRQHRVDSDSSKRT